MFLPCSTSSPGHLAKLSKGSEGAKAATEPRRLFGGGHGLKDPKKVSCAHAMPRSALDSECKTVGHSAFQ